MKTLLISHFYNEAEFLLVPWVRYHSQVFDHAVLIDYASTDNSCEIIKQLAPHWQIRSTRNSIFRADTTDAEVLEIEREFAGWWKVALCVTEFAVMAHHDHLNDLVDEFSQSHPDYLGFKSTGVVLWDTPEQRDQPLNYLQTDILQQRTHGIFERVGYANPRSRLFHRGEDGRYHAGRHRTDLGPILENHPAVWTVWFGVGLLNQKKRRNKSMYAKIPGGQSSSHYFFDDAGCEDWWQKGPDHEYRCGYTVGNLLDNADYAKAITRANKILGS